MQKNHFIRALRAAAFALAAFATCAAHAETVTDLAGRKVELPAKVDRILLGEGRLFYALSVLEGKQPFARLAGWQGDFRTLDTQTYAQYRRKFPQIDQIPLIGKTTENTVSAEKILALKPDIAVFSVSGHGPGAHNEMVAQLEAARIPVIFVDFRNSPLHNTVPSLRLMGKALKREAQADKFIRFYERNVRAVTDVVARANTKKPKVFLDVRAASLENVSSAGKGSLGEFIEAAGGDNIASKLLEKNLGEVNMEHVLAQNPDLYIATGGGAPDAKIGLKMGPEIQPDMARQSLTAVSQRDQVRHLSAIRNNRIYGAWHHFYVTPYHVALLQAIAKWQHPDLFAGLDPQQTWRDMHEQFLAVEPSGTYWIEGGTAK
jgi:iron complex transport system substrate-binding protein